MFGKFFIKVLSSPDGGREIKKKKQLKLHNSPAYLRFSKDLHICLPGTQGRNPNPSKA